MARKNNVLQILVTELDEWAKTFNISVLAIKDLKKNRINLDTSLDRLIEIDKPLSVQDGTKISIIKKSNQPGHFLVYNKQYKKFLLEEEVEISVKVPPSNSVRKSKKKVISKKKKN